MRNSAYVLITAAKNEQSYIRKTVETVINQTRLPKKWVILSDGSTDHTDEYVRDFEGRHDFIRLVRLDNVGERAFSSQAFASNAGYDKVKNSEFDFVGFLDADISLPASYYEELLTKFDINSRLGVAGGIIVEDCGGRLEIRYGDSGDYVAGAIQLFRRRCYEDIGGFIPLRWGGHDTVANAMATRKGWEVRAFPELRALHHRRTGTAGVSIHRSRFQQGMHDYFLGYHPLYEAGKCVRRILEHPYLMGSLLHICGYLWPCLNRERVTLPPAFVRYLRQQQLRRLFGKVMQQEEA